MASVFLFGKEDGNMISSEKYTEIHKLYGTAYNIFDTHKRCCYTSIEKRLFFHHHHHQQQQKQQQQQQQQQHSVLGALALLYIYLWGHYVIHNFNRKSNTILSHLRPPPNHITYLPKTLNTG
jgi:hypothetical protein